jgi:DNA-binding transcriptional MerR regulator
MFRIGEFSKIAQISIRMLRHYDEIGLLKPARVDSFTGYRYYIALQLVDVNRIVALKELGLTLEQIAKFIRADLSTDELHGMLLLKKAQTEQAIQAEITRLKTIESRIAQIEDLGSFSDVTLVLKSVPALSYLSIRQVLSSHELGYELFAEVQQALPSSVHKKPIKHFMGIAHDDYYDTENIDFEMGFIVNDDYNESISLDEERQLTVRQVAAVDTMLCTTLVGGTEETHRRCFNAMGLWLEQHNYRFAGAGRELAIELPQKGREEQSVTELQFPVEKLNADTVSAIQL